VLNTFRVLSLSGIIKKERETESEREKRGEESYVSGGKTLRVAGLFIASSSHEIFRSCTLQLLRGCLFFYIVCGVFRVSVVPMFMEFFESG